jgi:DNA-binding response OmpR family regulator
MTEKNLLKNKRILIVDDEPDILDALEELLPMCKIRKATNFDDAAGLIDSEKFDIAILDIMGVNGYELLVMARKKNILVVMLTAHALTVEDTEKAHREGAALYVPKEKMGEIETYLNDILEDQKKEQGSWSRWLDRFGSYYDTRFGDDWRDQNKDFWKNFPYFQ